MLRATCFMTVAFLLAACSGDPIDPASISRPDEVQAGPGLLTGEAGEYALQL